MQIRLKIIYLIFKTFYIILSQFDHAESAYNDKTFLTIL